MKAARVGLPSCSAVYRIVRDGAGAFDDAPGSTALHAFGYRRTSRSAAKPDDMPEPSSPDQLPPVDPAVAARLHRWGLAARLIMAFNTLVAMAILGFCLWKVGQLIGAW